MGCCCSKNDVDSPGDKAFDKADQAYCEYKKIDPTQRDRAEAQAFLHKSTKSYDIAANYYRAHNDANLGAVLVNLATLKWDVYRATVGKDEERSGEMLEEVVRLDEEALGLWRARESKPKEYTTLLANLADAYLERFIKTKQSEDIRRALDLYKEICTSTEKRSRDYIKAMMQIGITHWTWYTHPATHTEDQMGDAIQYLKNAEKMCADADIYPEIRASCLYHLAWIYHYRFERHARHQNSDSDNDKVESPGEDYLTQVIDFYRSTLQIMPPSDARYPKALGLLPMLLFYRYDRDKRAEDLTDAKEWARKALETPGVGDVQDLGMVRDFDVGADPDRRSSMRAAVRRGTLEHFRSGSAESSSSTQAPVMLMPSISEYDNGPMRDGGIRIVSGGVVITNEPEGM